MWKKMTARLLMLFFLLGVLPASYGQGYMHGDVWDQRSAVLNQNQLTLNVTINNGPGGYSWRIFYSNCSGNPTRPSVSYYILPKKLNIGGVPISMEWHGNVSGELDDWIIITNQTQNMGTCGSVGNSGHIAGQPAIVATGVGDLQALPPGSYNGVVLYYYVGSSFADSFAEELDQIKAHGLEGEVSMSTPQTFTGVAACSQDSPTSGTGTTIDFGTVTSNGTVQPGPLTTLGLVCNYDVALNDVTYSLTSNNPVTGEPSTGQNVAVALTNGATVTLDGGNVTQPDPKKVSVNISPSIDTRGAIAGEGTGSATLTFTYE